MGAGLPIASRPCVEDAPQHPRPHLGGQYAIGLFGCPGVTSGIRFQTEASAPDEGTAQGKTSSPLRLTLAREQLAVFVTVASHESRPLADVFSEALAEQAARWTRTRHTLLIDPRDRALLDDYLDSLEADPDRLERLEEEAAYRAATTPGMRSAAAAADEREMRGTDEDAAADFWGRVSGHEDIAIRLAIED